jgi:hypothetical protein
MFKFKLIFKFAQNNMLCNKCHEEIKSGEELKINDLREFCKKCAKKPFAHCQDCGRNLIYYKDEFFELSKSYSYNFFFWKANSTFKAFQCRECNEEIERIAKRINHLNEKGTWANKIAISVLFSSFFFIIGFLFWLFFPNQAKRFNQAEKLYKWLFGFSFAFLLTFFSGIIDVILKNRGRRKGEK